jgi:hypothetical protein
MVVAGVVLLDLHGCNLLTWSVGGRSSELPGACPPPPAKPSDLLTDAAQATALVKGTRASYGRPRG